MVIEFEKIQLAFQREMELKVYYEIHLLGKRRVDFLVEEKVLLETKALSEDEMGKSNQFFNYLEVLRLPVGLLINFGKPRLEFKRYINNKL